MRIKRKSLLIHLFEYLLAVMFIQGGVQVFFAEPAILPGVFAVLVGQFAIYIYGVIFFGIGVTLLLAKFKHWKKVHKHSLFAMFLSCFYVLVLAVAVSGITWGLTVTVLAGILSAWLWLNWTFQTEYIDLKQFRKDTIDLR